MKTAIIIIAFNTAEFLPRQAELFRKFCLDENLDIIVVDNSTNSASEAIKYHAEINGCIYARTMPETLKERLLAGIYQMREVNGEKKVYLWPGALMINCAGLGDDKAMIDFSPAPGLDTGGSLYKIIDKSIPDHIYFMDEEHHQNPDFNKNQYSFYSMIYNQTFMHCIAGSNWCEQPHHKERINSLFNVLDGRIMENE